MKKVSFLFSTLVLLAVGCNNKKEDVKAQPDAPKEVAAPQEQDRPGITEEEDQTITSESLKIVNISSEKKEAVLEKFNEKEKKVGFSVICSDARKRDSEQRHNIDWPTFKAYAEAHPENATNINFTNEFNWTTIYRETDTDPTDGVDDRGFFQRKNLKCYDGFFRVIINNAASLTYKRYNYFSCYIPMYPPVMFEGINLKLRNLGVEETAKIQFTKAVIPVIQEGTEKFSERIIFKVIYNTGSGDRELYYDMSDDPS